MGGQFVRHLLPVALLAATSVVAVSSAAHAAPPVERGEAATEVQIEAGSWLTILGRLLRLPTGGPGAVAEATGSGTAATTDTGDATPAKPGKGAGPRIEPDS